MQAELDEKRGVLKVEIPYSKEPQPSTSGKTRIVASSHGNQPTAAVVKGQPVIIGFNAYIKNQ